MEQPPAITLCMVVKNEERVLQACLDSVYGIADEIVIVDTGSSDTTPQIAVRNGARVIPFDFEVVDFAAARNRGIAGAAGRWILALDADETLDAASIPVVREIVAGNENAGYYFERRNHAPDLEKTTVDYAVRLFPNVPEYRYRGRVHETIDASILGGGGRLRTSGMRIDHHSRPDAEARRRKNHWYIGILKEELTADPTDDSRLDFLAAEFHQLGMFREATQVAECIAQVRPRDPCAHLNAGIYHLVYQADPVRARADFARALELKPGYPEAASFLLSLDVREPMERAP